MSRAALGQRRIRQRQRAGDQPLPGADHGAVHADARSAWNPAAFQVIAIKSRVHFRRGFDDSGFARTILLVEPTEPFLGTVRLDALNYQNVDLKKFYPFGNPDY